jgi:hypothetical protein
MLQLLGCINFATFNLNNYLKKVKNMINIYKKSMALFFLCGIANATYGVEKNEPQDSAFNRVKTTGQSVKEQLCEIKKKASHIINNNDYLITDYSIKNFYQSALPTINELENLNMGITLVLSDVFEELRNLYNDKKSNTEKALETNFLSNIMTTLTNFQVTYHRSVGETLSGVGKLIPPIKEGNSNVAKHLDKSKNESMISIFIDELQKSMLGHEKKKKDLIEQLKQLNNADGYDSSEETKISALEATIESEMKIANRRKCIIVETFKLFEKQKNKIKAMIDSILKIDESLIS